MRPLVFLSAWQVLAGLFAMQDCVMARAMNHKEPNWVIFEAWSIQFMIWGLLCLGMWYFLRERIQNATPSQLLWQFLPLSIVLSILEELAYVFCFRYQSPGHHHGYWSRVGYNLSEEFVTNVAIFWIAFALFRGIGYYQELRARETLTARLENQLVNARLQALRMQLNPHFLFNALNSVSSLMRVDVEVADEMLERLSSLLRITLEKGDAQKVRLQEEIEITQLYLSIQQLRYGDRVEPSFSIMPQAWDILVPTMVLQPVVENAFVHGVSRSLGKARINIQALVKDGHLQISVQNTCDGLLPAKERKGRERLGLANVKARLELHYGDRQTFSLQGTPPDAVTALFVLPIETEPRLKKEDLVAAYANPSSGSG